MIFELIKTASSFIQGYESEKSKLFNLHIEPLKQKIDEIHKDYIKSFLDIRTSLTNKEVPISEMLDFLENRRHDLSAQRDLIKQLAQELLDADRRIVTSGTWESFECFCQAVVNYFNAGNSIANASWYSDFIRFMKVSRMAESESTFFDRNVFGNNPRLDTINAINSIIDSRLPTAMAQINKYYAELRVSLL